LRMEFSGDLTSAIGIRGAYNFIPRVQDPSLFSDNPFMIEVDPTRYRIADFNQRLYPESTSESESVGLYQNLDRASLSIALPAADIYLGRQAIAWGSSKVINPIDVIAPFTFNELDTEERIGVDALRVRVPIGFMGEFDAGYIAGPDLDFEESAAFLRSKFYVQQTDLSLLTVAFRENLMFGVDMARSLRGAGVWLEAGYVFLDAFQEDRALANDYFRGTAGIDYSFSDGAYGFVEYHYSEAGVEESENYYWNFMQNKAYSEGSVYLLGTNYVIPGIVYQITPLITLTGQAIYNVDDRSLFLAPILEYNIAQNIYIGGGGFLGFGKNPTVGGIEVGAPFPVFRSEFGSYPDMFYTTFRIYY
ncbi:MAG TPA: hypothetical protein VKA68_09435, partial [bacterium]|nr:hypothetical protein [bacterium]